jgi:hypothetical protein
MGDCRKCGRVMVPGRWSTGTPAGEPVPPDGVVRHIGRGLCTGCYKNVRDHGNLADYPLTQYRQEEFLEEYVFCRDVLEMSDNEVADKMGVQRDSLATRLRRYKKRGINV